MKIYIAADHRGFNLKNKLVSSIKQDNISIEDLGAHELLPQDDYVDYAKLVGEKVSEDPNSRGIVLCGSGVGIDIASNKIKGVRCGLGFSEEQIKAAKRDDDINVLALPADYINEDNTKKMVKTFLETEFAGEERFKRRIEKIKKLELRSKN